VRSFPENRKMLEKVTGIFSSIFLEKIPVTFSSIFHVKASMIATGARPSR